MQCQSLALLFCSSAYFWPSLHLNMKLWREGKNHCPLYDACKPWMHNRQKTQIWVFRAPLMWLCYKDVVYNENCREHKSCFCLLCVCLVFNCLSCLICYIKCFKIPLFDLKHVKESESSGLTGCNSATWDSYSLRVFFFLLSYCQTEYAGTTNKSLPLDITVHNYQKWVIAADLLSIKSCQ